MRRFLPAVLAFTALITVSGCQVVLLGNPLSPPGATPVNTPGSDSVALAAPLDFSPVVASNSCGLMPSQGVVPDPGHATCYALAPPFLTVRRLDAISVLPAPGTPYWTIDLKLTPTDSQVVSDWTGANLGDQLAMVTGGVAVAAPAVQGQIVTDDVQVSGPFSQADATAIEQRITGQHPGA